ncbi:PhoX family protein [Caenimonas soli]|uniref:PhoX family protein n=1 Tax=Caenimonas soli TaxID=2735555 RepID=UPI0015526A21|nr:PhoX family phosphatase [Caenimonas soli]NPC54461.1 PhoX family phosphatase [Caenimonas soli]
MTAPHDDENFNNSSNPSFNDVLDARLTRRHALRVSVGTAGAAVLGSFPLASCGGGSDPAAAPAPAPAPAAATAISLSFPAVAKSMADAVAVPTGYTATVLYAMGDPLTAATAEFMNDGTDTGFDNRAGDHHDGMEYFGLNAAGTARDVAGSERGLLAMNHEALTDQFLHAAGTTANPRPAAEADKEIPAHGVSVVEVRKVNGKFAYQKGSAFNRRVTPATPLQINGPARGNALMKTKFSTAGTDGRGTINNCGTGYTPWGTFVTGEENWSGYFRRGDDELVRGGVTSRSNVSLARYGRAKNSASRHGWETAGADDKYARWDITQTGVSTDGTDDYRNELNTFGYIVEIDPYDKNVAVRKRTALGRFAHESAAFSKLVAGKPLAVYMGDDSRGEYIYKFVSTANWVAADASPANRITTGDKYLDSGKLYVAKYSADGTGQWIELNIADISIANYATYDFADQADVLVNARLAADAVGATKMDRPEWCAVHPVTGEVYYTLTNNSNRKVEPASSSQMAVDAANPRSYTDAPTAAASPGNVNGHIIRMKEGSGDAAALSFTWDVYLFGAQADADLAKVNLSALTADQDFSSPDGLWFSPKTGLCFIQTDDGAYTDVTNCMMLIGKPGAVGDGTTPTLSYTKGDGSTVTVQTRMGAKPTTDTLRRFLVGPKDCEITGISETPDGRTLFVNVQHPGETISKANVTDPTKYLSHWPGNAGYGAGGANARPRSATIVITRNDGGLIGGDGTVVLNSY